MAKAPPSAKRDRIKNFTPALVDYTNDVLYGDLWERKGLSKRDRSLWEAVRQGTGGRRLTFDGLLEQFLPGKYDPPNFTLKLATKDVALATAMGRELGVPMRICNLAYAEMIEACNRGWEARDSRVVMLLQQERAGVEIAADLELVRRAAERAKSRG
jgi:3-hydroxyisobutyrate dehydrogenase